MNMHERFGWPLPSAFWPHRDVHTDVYDEDEEEFLDAFEAGGYQEH